MTALSILLLFIFITSAQAAERIVRSSVTDSSLSSFPVPKFLDESGISLSWVKRLQLTDNKYAPLVKFYHDVYSDTSLLLKGRTSIHPDVTAECMKFIKFSFYEHVSCNLPPLCDKQYKVERLQHNLFSSVYICYSKKLTVPSVDIFALIGPKEVTASIYLPGISRNFDDLYVFGDVDVFDYFSEFRLLSFNNNEKRLVHKSCDEIYTDISDEKFLHDFSVNADDVCFHVPSEAMTKSCEGILVLDDKDIPLLINPVSYLFRVSTTEGTSQLFVPDTRARLSRYKQECDPREVISGKNVSSLDVTYLVCDADNSEFIPGKLYLQQLLLSNSGVPYKPMQKCVSISQHSINPISYAIEMALTGLETLVIKLLEPIISEVISILTRIIKDVILLVAKIRLVPEILITYITLYIKFRDHFISIVACISIVTVLEFIIYN